MTSRPPHVGAEDLGHDHRAIDLLVVLEHRHHGAAGGQSGAVEGVEITRFTALRWPVSEVGAAGLEVGEVGAGGDLSVAVEGRQPDLEIVGLAPRIRGRRWPG